MSHEGAGKTDEWYTPKYIFDALCCRFDEDVASPSCRTHVPARKLITSNSLNVPWRGFVWMNPPYGNESVKIDWLWKFFEHGHGLALMPDRTSAKWWQDSAARCSGMLFTGKKIKFERPDGSIGGSPSNGTTIFSAGPYGARVLRDAVELGTFLLPIIKQEVIE